MRAERAIRKDVSSECLDRRAASFSADVRRTSVPASVDVSSLNSPEQFFARREGLKRAILRVRAYSRSGRGMDAGIRIACAGMDRALFPFPFSRASLSLQRLVHGTSGAHRSHEPAPVMLGCHVWSTMRVPTARAAAPRVRARDYVLSFIDG